MDIYVNTCMHLHTYMHAFAYIHTYIHTYKQTNKHTYIHTNRQTDRQTYRHTDIQTDIHTYIQTYIHTDIYTYIHTGRVYAINICLSAVNLAEIKPPSPPRKQISQVAICLPTLPTPERWESYIYLRKTQMGPLGPWLGFKNWGHEGGSRYMYV